MGNINRPNPAVNQSGMIDICVGRMPPRPKKADLAGERVYVDNMLTTTEKR